MNLLYYKFILSQTFALLISLFIGLLISLTYFGKVYGDTKIFSVQETSKIKELILETLLEKPEVLIKMSQLLKKKEAQASQQKVKTLNYNMGKAFQTMDQLLKQIENKIK